MGIVIKKGYVRHINCLDSQRNGKRYHYFHVWLESAQQPYETIVFEVAQSSLHSLLSLALVNNSMVRVTAWSSRDNGQLDEMSQKVIHYEQLNEEELSKDKWQEEFEKLSQLSLPDIYKVKMPVMLY